MDNQEQVRVLSSASQIFSQAWSLYKQKFSTFVGIVFVPTLLLSVLGFIFASSTSFDPAVFQSKISLDGYFPVLGPFLLLYVFSFFINAWVQIALIYVVKDNGEDIGILEAYKRSWRKILSFWWVAMLTSFIMMGGAILFIIPGIIFAVWFSLSLFVLIVEDERGLNALLKSKQYVDAKWGGVAWRLIFIGIVFWLITVLISFGIVLVMSVLKFIPFVFGPQIIEIILGTVLTPLFVLYLFFLYKNLKELKGEMVFAPSKGQRVGFSLVGILGFLLIPIVIFALVYFTRMASRSLFGVQEQQFNASQYKPPQ